MRTGIACGSLLLLLGCQGGAPAADRLWWSSSLRLDSLEAIEGAMQKPWPDAVAVSKSGSGQATVSNCATSLELQAKGYSANGEREMQALQAMTVPCLVLRALRQGKLARRTGLSAFAWNAEVIAVLPPGLSIVVSSDDQRRVQAAVDQGQSWKDIEPGLRATLQAPDVVEVVTEGSLSSLTLLARGDFDGDGWEDLLIDVRHALRGGSYRSVRLVLVTRTRDRGPLQLVRDLTP